jgi:ApbE superfamily uncharacterized protein (UPF0280 family)
MEKSNEKRGFGKRFYREHMGVDRFRSFTITCKDSDLWIGVDYESFHSDMIYFAQNRLIELRFSLESHIHDHPLFGSSFIPVETKMGDPEIAVEMSRVTKIARTGPMASVAGAFSEFIGKAILKEFNVNEIVVENGGDIYLKLKRDLILSVYAGESPFSKKIGLEIPAGLTPIGVCTSAGTIGPSISFGNADAVMIASKNTSLADAFATAYGNRIKTADDIPETLELVKLNKKILSALIICEGIIGICGQFKIKPLQIMYLKNHNET